MAVATDHELICPSCRAVVRPEEEGEFPECAFCGSSLYLDPRQAVRHLMIPAVLERRRVGRRLVDWLRKREILGIPRKVACRLLYFPFWVVHRESGPHLEPAAGSLATIAASLRLPAGDLKAFRRELTGKATVVPCSVPLECVRDPASSDGNERLVHLPFWEVSYSLGAVRHRAWVDAVSGRVLPFSEPSTARWGFDFLYTSLVLGSFGAAVTGFVLAFQGGARSAAGIATLLAVAPVTVLLGRGLNRLGGRG
jgi:hypothetical protein